LARITRTSAVIFSRAAFALFIAFSAASKAGVADITVRPKRTVGAEMVRADVRRAVLFFGADFLAARFGAALFGAAFFLTARFGAAFLATLRFGVARFAAAFFGAAFFAAARFGAAFFAAVFLTRLFLTAIRSAFFTWMGKCHRIANHASSKRDD
ncbi:MAG: hypothetical protein DRR03_10055, partial [Gammaproteobacteria bacterium]